MKGEAVPEKKRYVRTPCGIALLYAGFALCWIVASDWLAGLASDDVSQLGQFATYKGLLFVGVTAALLYWVLRRWHRSLNDALLSSARLQQRLERVLQGTNDGWWDWDIQSQRIYFSPRWWQILGYEVNELPSSVGLWRRLAHPDDQERIERAFLDTSHVDEQGAAIELRLRHKDGHYVPVLSRYWIRRGPDGKPVSVSGANMDVTTHKQAHEQLRLAGSVFSIAREAIVIIDADKRIQLVNPSFTRMTGYLPEEVVGKPVSILRSGRYSDDFYKELWATVERDGYWQKEIVSVRKDGKTYQQSLSVSAVRNEAGEIVNYIGAFADISRERESEAELEFLANHDPLTRLPNRLLLLSQLGRAIQVAQAEQTCVALLLLDIDRFKDVNDSFGHDTGDALLTQVAQRLSAQLRSTDVVARLGGDEFAVILKGVQKPEDAGLLAGAIIDNLNQAWTLPNGTQMRIGASIGISVYPDHGSTTHELLQQADAALYQAKNEGRGCFRYFSQSLTHAARERIDLAARLHRAIEQDELRVYFQPQIDIATGRIVGAEALVRWHDPQEGMIPPMRFIPVAETTGLIDQIGAWVLRQTCLQGRQWQEQGLPPLTLAVNISPRQFLRKDLDATVAQILEETGFPATQLELEVTESALMEREQDAVQLLQRLREAGVRLAIDDFGTGYSSLAYLKHFPVDVLKIDKEFVDDVAEHDGAIAAAIVAMGHSLGFKVIAEGVETDTQLAFLKSLGCDRFQGYLVSKPVPAEEFGTLLCQQ